MTGKVEDANGVVHESVFDDVDDVWYYWAARVKKKHPLEIWWTACGSATGRLAGISDPSTTCLRCIANRSYEGDAP